MKHIETDIVIVGSGPGGATLARELARNGREVVLVEKGRWHNWAIGRYASWGTITKTIKSEQGGLMARGITAGGSSVVFNGNAFDPPDWLGVELAIDITQETAATKAELNIGRLPEHYYAHWPASRRLAEAADSLNIDLIAQPKFIDPAKCDPACDDCMLGCRTGAKWTAREYLREAAENGAKVVFNADVDQLIIENGSASGVIFKKSRPNQVRANTVILSAGGIGTPEILLRSGVRAGAHFFVDPMNVVMGVGKDKGTHGEMTFSYASESTIESDGYLIGNVGAPTVFWPQLTGNTPFRALSKAPYINRIVGLFVKVGDSPNGRIQPDGTIDKPYTAADAERFKAGTEACRQILIRAGANPESLCLAENIGGHPGGTAAIGRVVNSNLKCMDLDNLYVCDASVFPRSPGRPPTLTLIALAKRLAAHICAC